MAGSSPARRSYNHAPSSPLSDILYGDRNSEARHKQLLEAARREHDRVRLAALQALEDHNKALEDQQREEERRQILERERREQERIRQEQALAAERRRLQELQAQKVEIPPEPQPAPPPPKATPSQTPAAPATQPTPAASTNRFAQAAAGNSTTQQQPAGPPGPSRQSTEAPRANATQQHTPPSTTTAVGAFGAAPAAQAPFPPPTMPTSSAFSQVQRKPQPNGNTSSATSAAPHAAQVLPDRYETIHRNLKDLRRSMLDQAKTNTALKGRMGDMRREIRKCVGQLTHGVIAGNRKQVKTTDPVPSRPRPRHKDLVCFFFLCFLLQLEFA
jgi:nucleoporin GLE1